jgi:hypothetical protein
MNSASGISQGEAMILQSLITLERHVAAMAEQLEELRVNSPESGPKDWYTTAELAAMMGVTGHTVRERWCKQGRIECSQDPATGKRRIPGREYDRLRRGGRPEGI